MNSKSSSKSAEQNSFKCSHQARLSAPSQLKPVQKPTKRVSRPARTPADTHNSED